MRVPVLLGVTGSVEVELIEDIQALRSFTVVRRCAEGAELLAAARIGQGQIVIVAADFFPLDLDYLTALAATGAALILLITPTAPPALARVATDMGLRVAASSSEVREQLEDWHRNRAAERLSTGIIGDDEQQAAGHVTAVWGPAGAPGRSRMAIEIAYQQAARGARTLLIDADPYGGALAAALGLLDESSGLIAATRAAGSGQLSSPNLLQYTAALQPGLRLLSGIPRADRWPELTTAALERVWEISRESADAIVIDCGFLLETDEELLFDTHAPQRNGATLSALRAADTVVAVGQADPVQMPRLIRGLEQLREHVDAEQQGLRVAVTRVRASVAGRGADSSVREILARFAGVEHSHVIPEDSVNFDAALLAGKSVFETAPKSPAVTEISLLVDAIRAENSDS